MSLFKNHHTHLSLDEHVNKIYARIKLVETNIINYVMISGDVENFDEMQCKLFHIKNNIEATNEASELDVIYNQCSQLMRRRKQR
jgi:hypothetical protein